MIKNNMSYLGVMVLSSFLVGSFQLPLIENTLNKYGYENSINDKFPLSKNFQQLIEDQKIAFSSFINHEDEDENKSNNVVKKNIVQNNSMMNVVQSNANLVASVQNNTTNTNLPHQNALATTTKNQKCLENCVVLMIGDSVMGDVDFSMQRLIKKEFPSWKIVDGHKVSSGLTNQTYYDWPATARKLVEKNKPDYVFVLMGTNDAQGMMSNGKGLAFGKEPWINEYTNRVNKITQIVSTDKSSWYWIGLPVTKEKGFNSKLQVIRDVQENQTKEHYLSVENIFGKNDKSEPFDIRLRAGDGIHLNSAGADLVAKKLIAKLKE